MAELTNKQLLMAIGFEETVVDELLKDSDASKIQKFHKENFAHIPTLKDRQDLISPLFQNKWGEAKRKIDEQVQEGFKTLGIDIKPEDLTVDGKPVPVEKWMPDYFQKTKSEWEKIKEASTSTYDEKLKNLQSENETLKTGQNAELEKWRNAAQQHEAEKTELDGKYKDEIASVHNNYALQSALNKVNWADGTTQTQKDGVLFQIQNQLNIKYDYEKKQSLPLSKDGTSVFNKSNSKVLDLDGAILQIAEDAGVVKRNNGGGGDKKTKGWIPKYSGDALKDPDLKKDIPSHIQYGLEKQK